MEFSYDNVKGIQRLQLNTSRENCQFHLLDLFIIYRHLLSDRFKWTGWHMQSNLL